MKSKYIIQKSMHCWLVCTGVSLRKNNFIVKYFGTWQAAIRFCIEHPLKP